MITPAEHAQLFRELADELYSFVRNKPADSPTNKRQIDMVQRARQAAEETEGRRDPGPELVEGIARVIYEAMRFDRIDTTVDWQEGGNSFAQDEARLCARAVLARFGGGGA